MRPFFKYFGGKWRSAHLYQPPRHRTIIEPFAGSAGYSLRHPSRNVILCDLDETIVGIWRYLISADPDRVMSLPDVPDGGSIDDIRSQVSRAEADLIGFWLNSAVTRPCRSPSSWMRSGVSPGSFWGAPARERIASQVPRIRHWTVVHGCYTDIDVNGPCTWYVDPPYQVQGRHYRHGCESIDYTHLAQWCRSREGQVIVCEQEGAGWLPFRPLASIKSTRAGKPSAEVVWCSQPDRQADLFVAPGVANRPGPPEE